MGAGVAPEFVMAAPHVLHERVTTHDHLRGVVALEAPHGSQSRFEPAVVGFEAGGASRAGPAAAGRRGARSAKATNAAKK